MSLVAAFFVAVLGCAPHVTPPPPETKTPPRPKLEQVTEPPAPTRVETLTFSEELIRLDSRDPETPVRAVQAWVRHHAVADNSTRLAGLHRLYQTFGELENMYGTQIEIDPDAMERIAALEPYGIEVREVGAKLVHIDSRLVERHAGAILLPQERRWLRAHAWDAEHTIRMGGDDPQDLVRSILQWERVVDDGAPWAVWGRVRMVEVLELYLELCLAVQIDEPTSCPVTPEIRRSYRSFVAEHRDSRLHAAVAQFLEVAERERFELTLDDLLELEGYAKAAVTTERPSSR